MKKLLVFTSILGLYAMTSCTTMLDFQTARTVKKGENELIVSATSANIENEQGHTTPYVSPALIVNRGVGEKVDIGVNIQPFGLAAFQGRYQFYGDQKSKLSFATMGRLGFLYAYGDGISKDYLTGYSHTGVIANIDDYASTDEGKFIFDSFHTELSVLGSYFINKEMSVTSSLKGIYLPTAQVYTLGNTYGLEVGKKIKFSFQAGYNFYWEDRYEQKGFMIGRWQYGFGVKKMLNFGNREEEPETYN